MRITRIFKAYFNKFWNKLWVININQKSYISKNWDKTKKISWKKLPMWNESQNNKK